VKRAMLEGSGTAEVSEEIVRLRGESGGGKPLPEYPE
jgi:hypothetical protein